jgi:endonuclease/exonuclease/phosphatase family metal-dependent hydrolase
MRRIGGFVLALALVAPVGTARPAAAGVPRRAENTTATVQVVNQNLLHGTACAPDTARCALPGRVALFVRQLERARCPGIVAIEEGNLTTLRQLRRHLPGRCHYEVVYDGDPGQDREIVLTTGRVLGSERHRLAGPLRTAYQVRIGTAAGPVDLVATHLASSSDDRPCDAATCPAPCEPTDTLNTCQGREAARLLRRLRGPHSIAVLAGDLNATPDGPTVAAMTASGLVDTHTAAGDAECDPATGVQCTSGRVDDSLVDMKNPASKQSERIDYVMTIPTPRCRVVPPTGVFAASGGPTRADGIVFPADHSAVVATLRCRTTAADRAAARPSRTTTTTRAVTHALPAAIRRKVTAAFTGLFAPNPDPDAQLSHLEDPATLRDSFLARRAQVGDLANRTAARIDSFVGATKHTVDVTFSILLDGAVVLDSLPGQAKLVDGRWLVTTRTYCQVATLGVSTIPEACRATP